MVNHTLLKYNIIFFAFYDIGKKHLQAGEFTITAQHTILYRT